MNSPDRNSKPAKVKTILVLDGDVLVRMPVVQFLRDCVFLTLAEKHNTTAPLMIGHRIMGTTLAFTGDIVDALAPMISRSGFTMPNIVRWQRDLVRTPG